MNKVRKGGLYRIMLCGTLALLWTLASIHLGGFHHHPEQQHTHTHDHTHGHCHAHDHDYGHEQEQHDDREENCPLRMAMLSTTDLDEASPQLHLPDPVFSFYDTTVFFVCSPPILSAEPRAPPV